NITSLIALADRLDLHKVGVLRCICLKQRRQILVAVITIKFDLWHEPRLPAANLILRSDVSLSTQQNEPNGEANHRHWLRDGGKPCSKVRVGFTTPAVRSPR